jgi:chemotaxis protein methyltransferase CheR
VSVSATAHALLLDPHFPSLKRHLIETTGLAYYEDKDEDLATRIGARLAQLGVASCGAYADLLNDPCAGEPERHLLIGQLTIGETYFFRHTEQFDALRDVVLPDIIERNLERRSLRIWSAGCAIGAEPYSLAILLKQHFGHRLAGWDVQILGTDINQRFLARASLGEFDERALRSTPEEVRRIWLLPSDRAWTVRPLVREWVSFQYHNLVEHPYPSIVHGIAALDLILCRNVMIYFDWTVIAHIVNRFHDCLVDGGWLAVGHAESNPDVFRAYRTVTVPGATLYQKSREHRPAPLTPIATSPAAYSWPLPPDPQLPWAPPVLPPLQESPRSATLEHWAVTAVPAGLARVRRLADEGRWTDAASECEDALESDRLNPVVHFYRALIMEQLRRSEDAEQALRRTIYLDRGFVLAHYHLAVLLAKTGRRDAAVQSIRNVQALLARMDRNAPIPDADGLTPGNLGQLATMHLDLWRT